MIMGPNRIPIQKWFRDKANECSAHSVIIGEKITAYGGHPSMISAKIEETNEHSVQAILEESLKFEVESLELYKTLVKVSKEDIALEDLARSMVKEETNHIDEARKMLRKP
jgi:bacterioferritin